MLTAAFDSYRRHRFSWLFGSLLLTLGLAPMLKSLTNVDLWQALLAVNLLAAIATATQERWLRLLLILGAAFLVTRGVASVIGFDALLSVSQLLWVVTAAIATAATARYALRAGSVNTERVFAALDTYLLVGLIFGVCYWLLERVWPGSLGGAVSGDLQLSGAIYFSFVTLATLGYGDIVPVSELARGMAVVQAIGGQLYLAVLIARLVSLYPR
jgi:hypothetical protein